MGDARHTLVMANVRHLSDNLISVSKMSATEAARNFAEVLDAVEHRGERFTIVRRGRNVARIEPIVSGHGSDVKVMLTKRAVDSRWRSELDAVRELVNVEERS